MSQLKVNSIVDASGGSNAVLYGPASPAGSMGFRNRIINGAMQIDQRNAGAAVTASGAFPVDRFQVFNTTDGAYSAQQDTSAPAGFINSIKFTTTTADGTLTTTQTASVSHRIEGLNVADLGWGTVNAKTVTLSFWVRSSLTGTFGGALRNSANNRSYPFSYTISAADTWEQKSVTITGDTTGTWLTTNGIGIRVSFGLGVGPDRSGTAGAWAASNFDSVTGATSVIGTLNATFFLTGVQLEVGSVASEFERRPYGTELALCQRYYELTGFGAVAIANTSTQFMSIFQYKVSKRATPTASLTVTSNIRYRQYGTADRDASSASIGSAYYTTEGANVIVDGFSGLPTSSVAAVNYTTSSNSGNLMAFSAEL